MHRIEIVTPNTRKKHKCWPSSIKINQKLIFRSCYARYVTALNLSLNINISTRLTIDRIVSFWYWTTICSDAYITRQKERRTQKTKKHMKDLTKPDIQSSSVKVTSEFLLLRPEKKRSTRRVRHQKPETKFRLSSETSFVARWTTLLDGESLNFIGTDNIKSFFSLPKKAY